MRFKLQIIAALLSLKWHKWYFKNRVSALQKKRWKSLQKTLHASTFYAELAAQEKPISDFPLMNKSLFMEHFDAINTCGILKQDAFDLAIAAENSRDFSATINDITVGLSSGTSGNRGIFLASEKERAQWVACILDRVIGFSLKPRKVAFFLRANSNLYDSVKSKILHFSYFDLIAQFDTHVVRLNELNPDILVAPASALNLLAKEVEKGKLNIQPTKIIAVAEVLYAEDRTRLELIFGQTVHQVYQCTEGMLAASCQFGTLHFNEDFIHIEKKYLTSDHVRFHPIVTDLIRTSQPVIRYELNDIITAKVHCPCGSNHMAIEQIEGRSDDILSFEDANQQTKHLFPDYFRRAIILASEEIQSYQVVRKDAKSILLYTDKQHELAKIALENLLKNNQIEGVQVHIIEQMLHEHGTKLRRVRNDYQQTT